MRTTETRPSCGFTIIEILLALAIFAAVATIAYSRSGDMLGQMSRLEERTFAQWIADNTLAGLDLQRKEQPQPLAEGERTQRVRFAERDWRVTIAVSNTSHPTLQRVEIDVQKDEQAESSNSIVTLVGFYGVY